MRVLLIGYGSIAKKHVQALREIDQKCSITALRSGRDTSAIENIHAVFSLNEVNLEDFDFAIVSNPTFLHATIIEQLIPSKIPLFIEKPLFHSIEFYSLVEQIKVNNIRSYVACNLRFLDCIQFIKKEIINFRINEVTIYCGSYLPEWRADVDFRKSYSAHASMGGGVELDLIHELDYTYWLFGKPLTVKKFASSTSSLNIEANDYANYLLVYKGFTVNIILNYYRKEPKRTLEIVCENETINVDLLKNEVQLNHQNWVAFNDTIATTYKKQLAYFLGSCLTGEQAMNDVEEAFEILNICLKKD